ncbi:MAG TPA: trypsin-like peptidase domain-containing protein [Pseudonocardia sp.]|nr:trypsin-like peptidase domain-containing protein [Pseudonocardia sp.]
MTAVEGERAVGPPIDDQAAVPAQPEQKKESPAPPEQPEPASEAVPLSSPSDDEQPSSSLSDDQESSLSDDQEPSPSDDEQPSPSSSDDTDPPPSDDERLASPPDDDAAPAAAQDTDDPAPPPPVDPPAPAVPPRRRGRLVVGALLLAVLLTAGGGAVGAWAALAFRPPAAPPPAPAPTGLIAAVDAVTPAVLRIQSGAPDTGTAGTALVVTPTGDVVTNEHLVHGESTATLIGPDGRNSTARVIASDEQADVAWLRIDGAQGLPVARLAGPAAVRPGEDVVAIGNALNLDGAPSITRGIVSAVGRSTAALTDVIQTDAAISSGSSGGALVDRSGTVVGMTTEALVGDPSVSVEDIAFAIPADRVVTVLRGMGLELPTTG